MFGVRMCTFVLELEALCTCAETEEILSGVLLYHSLPVSLGFFHYPRAHDYPAGLMARKPQQSLCPSLQGLYVGEATRRFL